MELQFLLVFMYPNHPVLTSFDYIELEISVKNVFIRLSMGVLEGITHSEAFVEDFCVVQDLANEDSVHSDPAFPTEMDQRRVGIGLLEQEVLVVLHDESAFNIFEIFVHGFKD